MVSRAISAIWGITLALREFLTKKILLLQTRNPDFFYRWWLWRQGRANRGVKANRYAPAARSRTGAPFVTINLLVGLGESAARLPGTLASLREQWFEAWEAVVYVPAGRMQEAQAAAEQDAPDERVRWVAYPEAQKGRLYAASLEQAAGEYVCWAAAGGRFERDALAEIARQAEREPGADLFYYDEDVLRPGKACGEKPFLKPGWSPALLLSVNYLRGSFYRRAFLDEALGKDAQIVSEWDLALRCSTKARRAVHIARVFFHAAEAASAGGSSGNDEALTAHLERLGMAAPAVNKTAGGSYPRLAWKIRSHRVSVVIPTKDHLEDLRKCIGSIQVQDAALEHEIIVIDTGSTDAQVECYYEEISRDPRVTLLRDTAPFNYSRVNNLGVARASGDLLLFLNNDVQARQPGWIEELARWMEYPGVGVVGPKLLFPDGTIQHAGIVLGMEGHASHVFGHAAGDFSNPFGSLDWYRNYLAVTGACMMTSRSLFEQIGGFDEAYRLVFSDVEYCLQAVRQGYQVMYTPFCQLVHYEGRSRARYMPPEDIQYGYQRFIDLVREGDPYYPGGLSYSVRTPVLGWGFEQRPARRLESIYRISTLRYGAMTGTHDHDS